MAGERCLRRDLRRLAVANFADEHDVGILTQQRTQCTREGDADLLVHRNLGNTCELILDRILDGENLFAASAQPLQRGV